MMPDNISVAAGVRGASRKTVKDVYVQALGKGRIPDPWQYRLAMEPWPEVLIAPTGSGKTAGVTLGWAAHRLHSPNATPRRLVWCLPMRTLVDQAADVIMTWFDRLRRIAGVDDGIPTIDDIHVIMGGVEAARWFEKPERPAILVGTQDMLLSRALMRGYASSRANWPIEFALLHSDTQWVFDEVQLMGAGRATSSQLEAFRRQDLRSHPGGNLFGRRAAKSLWISATLRPDWLATVDFAHPRGDAVRVVTPINQDSRRLQRLSKATKILERSNAFPATAKDADMTRYLESLVQEVVGAHRAKQLTVVIVNRVDRAQRLYTMIRSAVGSLFDPTAGLALIHGRFRADDRQREVNKMMRASQTGEGDLIIVATQAIEAGVDMSAAVLFSELAPWTSMVQRFGRANRYGECARGADVRWIDLLAGDEDGSRLEEMVRPYSVDDLEMSRDILRSVSDVSSANLPEGRDLAAVTRVLRRRDFDALFDTDSDLTGFDLDVSRYIRDEDDTDVRVFWRHLNGPLENRPRPAAEELCAVPFGLAKQWIKNARRRGIHDIFRRDPQFRAREGASTTVPGWNRLERDQEPWPGLTLLVDVGVGGYRGDLGFTGDLKHVPEPTGVHQGAEERSGESDGHDEDVWSQIGVCVALSDHLKHVAEEAQVLCSELGATVMARDAVVRAARWHDVGKAHDVFQDTMRRGLGDGEPRSEEIGLLAKTINRARHGRPYFRHELASALALLANDGWSRSADLVAYLVAAHHGKVRLNLRALPSEKGRPETEGGSARYVRGIWDGDELPRVDVGFGESWQGGPLLLSVMDIGLDETTGASWIERTRELLTEFGPFDLAWMETLVRLSDWRASGKEERGEYKGN